MHDNAELGNSPVPSCGKDHRPSFCALNGVSAGSAAVFNLRQSQKNRKQRDRNMSRKCRGNSPIIGKLALAIPFLVVYIGVSPMLAGGQTAVTTYHYDNYRTGWNQNESQLTPAQVGSSSFGLLQTVTLDAQVDAQPLVVPGVVITAGPNQGAHDVVYVATENNTVYAIDVHSGTVLLSPNFGPPTGYPLGCNSSGRTAGINSTPVIDLASNTLYVMVYTSSSGNPTYILHALDLGS